MKRGRWRVAPCALLALGLIGLLCSMGALLSIPDALQYAVAAPAADEAERVLEAKREFEAQLADCTEAVAVGGVTGEASVSGGSGTATAAVYSVGEGWFEVHPVFLMDGRRITETELQRGEKVAMLDAELAFSLFGSELPEDARVMIGATEYAVVGTLRHSRSVGETAGHCAYVPLAAEPEAGRDVLMVVAKPIAGSGARTVFESTMRTAWRQDGCFYSLEKEVMRRTILPRMLLLVFGLSAIFALGRRMNGIAARWIKRYRDRLQWNYFRKTVPTLLATALICLLGYGALLAALYGLMEFSVQPLLVFTEWVPENVVEWSSLSDVFWNLTQSAARLVKVGTREMRTIEFWGGILRWSMISLLCGALLMRRKRRAV